MKDFTLAVALVVLRSGTGRNITISNIYDAVFKHILTKRKSRYTVVTDSNKMYIALLGKLEGGKLSFTNQYQNLLVLFIRKYM